MDPSLYPGPSAGAGGGNGSGIVSTPPQYQPQPEGLHHLANNVVKDGTVGREILAAYERDTDRDDSLGSDKLRMKRKRASKACDACRIRKVKCDSSRIPCPQCTEHEIPCLFTTPAKKRGPPNTYVEAHRLRMQQISSVEHDMSYSPANQFQDLYGSLASSVGMQAGDRRGDVTNLPFPSGIQTYRVDSNQMLGAHESGLLSFAPREILDLMFDDFFNLVFPICPIIVESRFRDRLADPSNQTDSFLALCGAILGATLACLRLNQAKYGGLVFEHAYEFSTAHLGQNYRDRLTIDISATLQYLSLGDAFSNSTPIGLNTRNHMLRAEFNTAMRCLAATRLKSCGLIESQLLKRMYVHIYHVEISLELQGLKPQTAPGDLAALAESLGEDMRPLDLSDADLERFEASNETGNHAADASTQFSALLVPSAKSYVPGLNLLTGLYKIYVEGTKDCGSDRMSDTTRLSRLFETLHKLGRHLENVPVQLRWEENNKVHGMGFEVQKALIYVSRMHLSSVLLEQCYALKSVSSQPNITQELDRERRLVITETLRIIKTISRRALEANGLSFIIKIRQVASTLVDIIQTQLDEEAQKARQELCEFSEILGVLDPRPSQNHSIYSNKINEDYLSRAEAGWTRFRKEQNSHTN